MLKRIMGCGGSKDDPSKQDSKSVSKNVTASSSNKEFHHDKLNLDIKASIDSPSPIELDHDEHIVHKSTRKQTDFASKETDKQSSIKAKNAGQMSESPVASAWTPTQKIINNKKVHAVNDIDEDSEFGRDGIDFYSESLDEFRKKSSGKRTETNVSEIPSNIDHSSVLDVSPRLTKKQSEEPFDPRPLIDVDKFKAANVAGKEVRLVNNNNGTVTIETRANVAPPLVGQSAPVASPSNYQDFYDDDEKELMATIEQDFIPTALPGVVT